MGDLLLTALGIGAIIGIAWFLIAPMGQRFDPFHALMLREELAEQLPPGSVTDGMRQLRSVADLDGLAFVPGEEFDHGGKWHAAEVHDHLLRSGEWAFRHDVYGFVRLDVAVKNNV
jgi:hypothetical protein